VDYLDGQMMMLWFSLKTQPQRSKEQMQS